MQTTQRTCAEKRRNNKGLFADLIGSFADGAKLARCFASPYLQLALAPSPHMQQTHKTPSLSLCSWRRESGGWAARRARFEPLCNCLVSAFLKGPRHRRRRRDGWGGSHPAANQRQPHVAALEFRFISGVMTPILSPSSSTTPTKFEYA